MSLRKWKNEFKKREFISLIKAVANKNMLYFNYTKKPFLIETKLPDKVLMSFCVMGKSTFITYDYAKFKRVMGQYEYNAQYVYAVQCMAHEMRHYYQHRQITAESPIEDKKTISNWKKNKILRASGMKKTKNYEYWFSSRELDANLYSYIFALEHVESASLDTIVSKEHFKALEKLYKESGGKNSKKYFPNKIKKLLEE